MATGDRLQIADKPTLDNVNKNLGETADAGGSMTTGTSMAKLNEDIRLSSATLQEVQNLGVTMNGEASPYGTGLLGDVTFNSANFTWPTQDFYNRYIIQVKSLTIPEGQTMKPPAKCDGLYILSQGDVNINGNIDIRGLRKTFGDVKISPTINVGTRAFELARGGYAPKGGKNGAGGDTNPDMSYDLGVDKSAPSLDLPNPISGNVNGGGVGPYGIGGASTMVANDYRQDTIEKQPYDGDVSISYERYKIYERGPKTAYQNSAPTALIIIAKGKVIINGQILASATIGNAPTEGSGKKLYTFHETYTGRWGFTVSGNGTIPPSGGGAITIICNNFTNNGKIDTNGYKRIDSNKPDLRKTRPEQYQNWLPQNQNTSGTINNASSASSELTAVINRVRCSQGGFGGTFVSTAGQIKVYEGVDE